MENLFNFLQTFFGRRRRCCNIRRQYTAFNFARHCHFLHLFFINTNFSLPLCLRYKFQHKKVFLLCQSFWVDTWRKWRLVSAQMSIKFGFALHALSLLFFYFISTTAYLWADLSLHLPLAVALPVKKHLILWFELTSSCSWAHFYNHWIRFPAER